MGLNEKDAVWISVSVGIVAILGVLGYRHNTKVEVNHASNPINTRISGGRKTMRSRKYKNRSRKV
jgi:hypothetical protein